MSIVYLGIGSNLGDREAHIHQALSLITGQGAARLLALSPLYETEPWGILEQPRFLNAAAALETDLPPHPLLALLKQIEAELGRIDTIRNGPRPIDLDILMYGHLCLETPVLSIPHPGMLQRSTVLVPLVDIAPDVRHPCSGQTMREHLALLTEPLRGVAPYPPGLES